MPAPKRLLVCNPPAGCSRSRSAGGLTLTLPSRAANKSWSETRTKVKMQSTAFAEGAMRRCYRMLKETQARIVNLPGADSYHRAWLARTVVWTLTPK
jgi:hypothetical protein